MAAEDMELFSPELVFIDFDADDRDDFFKKLSVKLMELGYVKESLYDAITTREKNFPTGLMSPAASVAIPHTEPEHLIKPYIAIIVPSHPVEFEFMGGMGDPVQAELMFNLGIMRHGGQVEMLQSLMNLLMNEEAVAELKSQTSPEGMIEAVRKYFA